MYGQLGMSMIKVCLRKRRDISDEEFHRYWLENHGFVQPHLGYRIDEHIRPARRELSYEG